MPDASIAAVGWLRRLLCRIDGTVGSEPLTGSMLLRYGMDQIDTESALHQAIADAAAAGPVHVAAVLCSGLFREDAVGDAARDIQQHLLDEATAAQITRFDQAVRALWPVLPERAALPTRGAFSAQQAAVLCAHVDGHVRARFVAALRDHAPSVFAARMVALRLRDWVPAVRDAAQQTMRAQLERPGARAAYVAAWPLLADLDQTRGADQIGAVDLLRSVLFDDGTALLGAVHGDRLDVARSAARLLVNSRARSTIEAMIGHRDPPIRRCGVRAAARAGALDLVHAAVADAVPQIAAAAAAEAEDEAVLKLALRHDNGSVRRAARDRLRQRFVAVDVVAHARAQSGADLPARGLVGLIELWGDLMIKDRADDIEQALSHPAARVRAAALTNLDLLDEARARPHLEAHLYEDSGRAVRAAARALARRGHAVDPQRLAQALSSGRPGVAAAAAQVVRGQSTWEALCLLAGLFAGGATDGRLCALVWRTEGRIGQSVFTRPRQAQLDRIRACLPGMVGEPKETFTRLVAEYRPRGG